MCRYGHLLSPQARIQLQLTDWIDGVGQHNETDGTCVPDYSCCYPTLEAGIRAKNLYIQYLTGKTQFDHDMAVQMESMFRGALMVLGGQVVVCNDAPYDLDAYH